ncbi:hypothetical protein [Nocardioides sp.]|uniref:hypothetical protein n=1 Tax=Nocardioides sp. TaxID=35761 RepID=UPI002C5153B7|nr:hypothetical protein [Nocardioides sp.]HSX68659.1 hypothetical protein [Nocardioides sp.]
MSVDQAIKARMAKELEERQAKAAALRTEREARGPESLEAAIARRYGADKEQA